MILLRQKQFGIRQKDEKLKNDLKDAMRDFDYEKVDEIEDKVDKNFKRPGAIIGAGISIGKLAISRNKKDNGINNNPLLNDEQKRSAKRISNIVKPVVGTIRGALVGKVIGKVRFKKAIKKAKEELKEEQKSKNNHEK